MLLRPQAEREPGPFQCLGGTFKTCLIDLCLGSKFTFSSLFRSEGEREEKESQ